MLVDSYGEDCVGAEIPLKQLVKKEKKEQLVKKERDKRSPNLARHIKQEPSPQQGASPAHHESPSHCDVSNHSSTSDNSQKLGGSPCSSPKLLKLPSPSWAHRYSAIPQYDPKLPKVLREGKGHTQHKVVYQKPLLAMGSFLENFVVDDPHLKEMEKATRIATLKREAQEREEQGRDRDEWSWRKHRRSWEKGERGYRRSRGWESHGRDRSRSSGRAYSDRSHSSGRDRERIYASSSTSQSRYRRERY